MKNCQCKTLWVAHSSWFLWNRWSSYWSTLYAELLLRRASSCLAHSQLQGQWQHTSAKQLEYIPLSYICHHCVRPEIPLSWSLWRHCCQMYEWHLCWSVLRFIQGTTRYFTWEAWHFLIIVHKKLLFVAISALLDSSIQSILVYLLSCCEHSQLSFIAA